MVKIFSATRLKLDKSAISRITQDIMIKKGIAPEYLINVVFVGKRKMKKIANTYKKENVALPVLTFSYKDMPEEEREENLFGEIIICYSQAILLAAEREKKVMNMLTDLIDHGLNNLLIS
jgi:rRNA maturation RNase YbeY